MQIPTLEQSLRRARRERFWTGCLALGVPAVLMWKIDAETHNWAVWLAVVCILVGMYQFLFVLRSDAEVIESYESAMGSLRELRDVARDEAVKMEGERLRRN